VIRHWQFSVVFSVPFPPVCEIPGQGLLVQVEIEARDALSSFKQRHDNVHGKCGFAAATFLVTDDDNVRRKMRAVGWYDRGTHNAANRLLRERNINAGQQFNKIKRLVQPSLGPWQ
jgi:hypothetical protein